MTGGDHGAGAFRCPIRIVLKFDDGSTSKYVHTDCSIAHIQCRKDNGNVLENTIIKPLGNGLKQLQALPFLLYFDADGELHIQQTIATVQQNENSILMSTNLWITGNLAYYVIMVGKEGSSGHWCYRCDLHKDTWKLHNHECGILWTNERLKAMADSGNTGAALKGVEKISSMGFY